MQCPPPEQLAQLGLDGLNENQRGALLDHAADCADCHAAVAMLAGTTPTDTSPGPSALTHIDRYELRRVVGRGGMGIVYAAYDPELARDVAVKLLGLRATAARLRREAQALARLTHPNVVRVYDVGECDGRTFIAMELVDGENLREWLRSPRSFDQIHTVLLQAGRGLAAAHAAGLVHRDFKPDNVFIPRSGETLVGDFGLARSTERDEDGAPSDVPLPALETLTQTGALLGTPAYMAPEQEAGEATAASDQYAFCVTAWEAFFDARPAADAAGERAVPARVKDALRRGLSPGPADRFPNMDSLLAALATPPRRRWPWFAGGAVALASAAAILAPRESPPACEADAATAIAKVWTPAIAATLTSTRDASVTDELARYASSWQAQRADACRATHERKEQTVATLERRVACLDRAKLALGATLDALLSADSLPRPANVIEGLPSLERCVAPGHDESIPPPDKLVAISTLEHELTAIDVSLRSGSSSVSFAAATALRERADKLGSQRQVLRAMLIEARVATWSGDATAAEAILRRAIEAADRAADDFSRADASARLAFLLASHRLDEARGLIVAARGALARAGDDPAIGEGIIEAEVAVASASSQHQEAVAHQQRLIASIRARLGEQNDVLLGAFTKLHVLWMDAGNLEQSLATERIVREMYLRSPHEGDLADVMSADSLEQLARGDFEGAAELEQHKLAVLRSQPQHSVKTEGYVVAQLAFAFELDSNYRDALTTYREAERVWSLPPAAFTTVGEQIDPAAITLGILEAVESQAQCLLNLGQPADAVSLFQRARELATAGGDVTRDQVPRLERGLGVALVAAGHYREGRDLLAPFADALQTDPELKPLTRAKALFALAQALWVDGGERDRPRARALAADADKFLLAAIADSNAQPVLRKLAALARAEQVRLAAWRTAHP